MIVLILEQMSYTQCKLTMTIVDVLEFSGPARDSVLWRHPEVFESSIGNGASVKVYTEGRVYARQ